MEFLKGLLAPILAKLGSRKFLVAIVTGAIVYGAKEFGLDAETTQLLVTLAAAYIGGEALVDGLRALAQRGTPLKLVALLVLPAALLLSGCKSTQAVNTVNNIEISAISYHKNIERVLEGFIGDYRVQAQAKADELADAALRAEINPVTGQGNAKNLQLILEKKAEHYALIELRIVEMRKKIIAANTDIDHLLKYSAGLRDYFQQRATAGELLNKSAEDTVKMIEQFVKPKPKAQIVAP